MIGTHIWTRRARPGSFTFLPATRLIVTRAAGEHASLESFLEYATRVSLDRKSTTFQGTCYEYVVGDALARSGLVLERTGGRLDKGIDLLGVWPLPTLPEKNPLNVIVQCKALGKKLGPSHVREMEGAFAGTPASWRIVGDAEKPSNVLGLLVAPKEATKGVRDAIARSRSPMAFAMVERTGRLAQIFWNKAAALKGLDGVKVQVRRTAQTPETDSDGSIQNGGVGALEEVFLLPIQHETSDPLH